MSYTLKFTPKAENDLVLWRKSGQVKTIKKIIRLFDELKEHPETGIGHPEMLRDNFSGYWSRKIDKKNRLIYRIESDIVVVEVISLYSHYEDK